MKKILSVLLVLVILSGTMMIAFTAKASGNFDDIYTEELKFMSDQMANEFIGFIYNKAPGDVTDEERTTKDIFNYLTGRLQKGSDEYIHAQSAFLLTLQECVNKQIKNSSKVMAVSSENLINLLKNKAGGGDVLDSVVDEELEEITSIIGRLFSYVFDKHGDAADEISVLLKSYNNATGVVGKVDDVIFAIETIVNSSFLASSYNTSKAYDYFSTYVNIRNIGPEYVDTYMLAVEMDTNFISDFISFFSSMGFGNSWTDVDIQRELRTFGEFTYHSKVEFQEYANHVPEIEVENLMFSGYEYSLFMNQTVKKTAFYLPENANSGTSITYSSSNSNIITVESSSGKITPVSAGSAYIVATSGNGVVARLKINVLPYTVAENESGYTILKYSGDSANVAIPQNVNGKLVTKIQEQAFAKCKTISSVTIPEGVEEIGVSAFSYCSNLTYVSIPSTVKTMGYAAFYTCENLVKVEIAEGASEIGRYSFAYCEKLSDISIPDSIRIIDDGAFWDCKFTEFSIPDGVERIGDDAFRKCVNLSKITIPDTVTCIGEGAFWGCTSLKEIIIPNSVTEIGKQAFRESSVTKIDLPDKITRINDYTFLYCYDLAEVDIPSGVTSIGVAAFCNCKSLKEIKLPQNLSIIESTAFDECDSLTSVVIPGNVTEIGGASFSNCDNLQKVTISNGVKIIDNYAFSDDIKLTDIEIPDSVHTIGDEAFEGCTQLTKVNIPSSVTVIGRAAYDNSGYYNTAGNWENDALYIDDALIAVKSTGRNQHQVKDGTRIISRYAFSYNTDIERLYLPKSIKYIGIVDCECLKEIYYYGNKSEWDKVELGLYNYAVEDAILHYEVTADHYGEGVVIVKEDCTTKGSIRYTCPCGYEKFETIPALGHDLEGNICTRCGYIDVNSIDVSDGTYPVVEGYRTIVYTDTLNWGTANIYVWDDDKNELSEWPGISMKFSLINTYNEKQYVAYIPEQYNNFIINNGTLQTEDYKLEENIGVCIDTVNSSGKYSVKNWEPDFYDFDKNDLNDNHEFEGTSLTVSGNVGVNFHMTFSEELINDGTARVVFTLPNGVKKSVPVSSVEPDEDGYYVFTCEVAAKEMTSEIKAQVVNSRGEGEVYSYSVIDYARYILQEAETGNTNYTDAAPLVKAMLNYGAAAQEFFGHKEENLANSILDDSDKVLAEDIDLSAFKPVIEDGSENVSYYGSALSLNSETTIKHYFRVKDEENIPEFYVNNQLAKVTEKDGLYEVRVEDIPAQSLDEEFVVTADGLTLSYNAFSYGYYAMQNSDAKLQNIIKALYAYNQTADAYIANTNA